MYTLFFVNQAPEVVEQFRLWLGDTGVQCLVVEPIARAFSLVVRDDPWGVVLSIDDPVGEKLCAQIRDDDLLEDLKVIALSRGANSSQLTEHMFGPASADVYGRVPLEDGIVDVWLRNQLALPTGATFSSTQNPVENAISKQNAQINDGSADDEFEIELTADLSVSSEVSTVRSDSTLDERIARLELELFEQSEKMTLVNRNLLRNQLALQERSAQNAMLKAECDRLSEQMLSGSADDVLRNECQRLSERLQIAEQALEQVQKSGVDVGLQEVESLSPQDLLGQIAVLRQSRDEKIEQVNVLHGELQLTRQAVNALHSRTQKAEERLTETQDIGQLREQQMQREFVSLQRQISNGARNLEISNHRGNQLNQQLDLLRERLKDLERIHHEERDHWIQKAEKESGGSKKESDLLLEIDGLTQALQAQLLGDADGSEEARLIGSLEGRLQSSTRELEQAQSTVQHLEVRNAQLTQKLTEREQQVTVEESEQWIRQQQVLDTTLKSLEDSLARQDELEQQLVEVELASQRVESTISQLNPEFDQRLLDAEALNSSLQERLAQALDEVRSLDEQKGSYGNDLQDVVSLEVNNADLATLRYQYQQEVERLQEQQNATPNPASDSDQMVLGHLQKAISEIESQRKFIEEELEDAHAQVRQLTEEQSRLQCALEDSQSMADAVEALTDEELLNKTAEVEQATEQLRERESAYQELESHTALVIGERDDMWTKIEDLSVEQSNLQADLEAVQIEKSDIQQQLQATQSTLNEKNTALEGVLAQVTELEAEMATRTEELTSLQQDLSEKSQASHALESENQALSEQRQMLLSEQRALKEATAVLDTTIDDLTDKLNTAHSNAEALRAEIETLSVRLAEGTASMEAKSTELEAAQSALQVVSDERDHLQGALQSLEGELSTLRAKVEATTQELSTATENHASHVETLSAEHAGKLEQQSQAYEIQLSDLQSSHEAHLASTVDDLRRVTTDLESKHQISIDELTATRASLEQAEESIKQHEDDNRRLQSRVSDMESQITADKERNQLHESEQVTSLTEELHQVRAELTERQETILLLREQLADLLTELKHLRTVETQLDALQTQHADLEAELLKVQAEWSTAETVWETERVTLQEQYENARIQAETLSETEPEPEENLENLESVETDASEESARESELESELLHIREQRADLLKEVETWTRQHNHKADLVKELRQTGSTVLAELQAQRDDAHDELQLLRLEMGIVQSAARQLAQQAERMRRDVFTKESSWKENLAEKDAENARLRARIERMDRGLSSLFVKRPTF